MPAMLTSCAGDVVDYLITCPVSLFMEERRFESDELCINIVCVPAGYGFHYISFGQRIQDVDT